MVDDHKNTSDDFFRDFHTDDQDILVDQVFIIDPRHPENEAFDIQDVLGSEAILCLRPLPQALQRRVRRELCGCSKTGSGDTGRLCQRCSGTSARPNPQHETQTRIRTKTVPPALQNT